MYKRHNAAHRPTLREHKVNYKLIKHNNYNITDNTELTLHFAYNKLVNTKHKSGYCAEDKASVHI